MLETRNLVKIYKPKKGVPVRALDGVSLKFPDKGMVFLLGKSGSGKSTLLNVLGGLDKYDGGDIIIKGVSSKDFSQKHFDSYRNTYVGFIFQEYNVLEEFTVGANIALALELQGKKATDEELNRILDEVDLTGFGNRRPHELSGGQKQRVAIARALVKNPKIIMADEPTGALDSVTGKQVFDTLKKLSREKLVIVVSHDREFATNYADRIIELADGRVISDTTLEQNGPAAEEQAIAFDGNTATVPLGYHLTEEDRIAINNYIDSLQSGITLEFRKASGKSFAPTDNTKVESTDKTPFKLIKSKLSLKHAFKIGGSGLKYKKFRLVMTILLSCVAFVLFGLVDTFSSYDHIQTSANSIYDTGITYAAVSKQVKVEYDDFTYWDSYGKKMTDEEIIALASQTGIDFMGVLTNNTGGFWFGENLAKAEEHSGYDLTPYYFSGMVEFTQSDLDYMGYSLIAGRLPEGAKNEIAISKFVCDAFIEYGYYATSYNSEYGYFESDNKKITISSASDMVGKALAINNINYTVVGVVDTNFDMSRYESLGDNSTDGSASGQILDYVLYSEFESAVSNDFTGMMLVGIGYIDRYIAESGNLTHLNNSHLEFSAEEFYISTNYVTVLENVRNQNIIWLDGEKDTLAENEILISNRMASFYPEIGYYNDNGVFIADYDKLKDIELNMQLYDYNSGNQTDKGGYKIVGIVDTGLNKSTSLGEAVVVPDSFFNANFSTNSGNYDMALGAMPKDKNEIKVLAEYCYTERDGVKYSINNPACYELDALNEIIDELADIFLYVGIGFAIFASILLSNFIATSISYKKQEIGILRAIGSRGNDVFRIFFSEAFIIAMINFVLAAVGTGFVTFIINSAMREQVGLLVTVLNFGVRQILVLFVISLAVAAIASFLPVKKVASKRPIDAIRNR